MKSLFIGLLLVAGAAHAHNPWTIVECAQYANTLKTAAEAKAMGRSMDEVLRVGIAALAKKKEKHQPVFIQDEGDFQVLVDSLKVVYGSSDTPKELREKAYEACLSIMVGKLKSTDDLKKFN